MNKDEFFQELWDTYTHNTVQAQAIHDLFNQPIVNDHVAFRTLDLAPINIETLEPLFLDAGYYLIDIYHFEEKRLNARAYYCEGYPKIFISEFITSTLNKEHQDWLKLLAQTIDPKTIEDLSFLNSGRTWTTPSYIRYEQFLQESEYLAWFVTMGFCANHFTVSVNDLDGFDTIEEVNQFLKDNGFTLNSSGGEVKGTPDDLLVQSSTIADSKTINFFNNYGADVKTCYYEFAQRYMQEDGELFQGFVTNNADKIFESTNR